MNIEIPTELGEILFKKLRAEIDLRKLEAERSDPILKTKLWVLTARATEQVEFHIFAAGAEAAVIKFKRAFPDTSIDDIRGAGSMNLIP